MQVLSAKVKYPVGRAFEGKYGARVNAVAVTPEGEEIKLWGNEGDRALSALQRGQSIQVVCDRKGTYKLVEGDTPNPQPRARGAASSWSAAQKQAIAASVEQHADLLAHCLKVARSKFVETGLVESEESLQTLATALFIQGVKGRF